MGAEIVGPASTLEQAQRLLDERPIDMAVLDIKLRDAVSYPLADELVARRVPVVFATCFDAEVIPTRFAGMPRCVKPASSEELAALLTTVFDQPPGARPKWWPRPRFTDRRMLARRRSIATRPSATSRRAARTGERSVDVDEPTRSAQAWCKHRGAQYG